VRRSLPLADAPALRRAGRRTAIVRGALTAAALAAIASALLAAKSGATARAARSGPAGAVVVLDVSGSIDARDSREIQRSLAQEVRRGGRVGLVLFSDTAMEALPPTAPASALQPFRRFFVALRGRARAAAPSWPPGAFDAVPDAATFPRSPWGVAFSGGTSISTGLREARAALRRSGLAGGRVVLLSDLVDAPEDEPALRRELAAYARDPALDLHVRALTPAVSPQPLGLYRKALGDRAVTAASAAPPPRPAVGDPAPLWLILAAVAAAGALAANELVAAPLRWRAPAEGA
jgi:hypothetical protein